MHQCVDEQLLKDAFRNFGLAWSIDTTPGLRFIADQATRFVTTETLAALGEKLQASIERNQDDLNALAKRIDLREGQVSGSRLTSTTVGQIVTIVVMVLGLLIVIATWWVSSH